MRKYLYIYTFSYGQSICIYIKSLKRTITLFVYIHRYANLVIYINERDSGGAIQRKAGPPPRLPTDFALTF